MNLCHWIVKLSYAYIDYYYHHHFFLDSVGHGTTKKSHRKNATPPIEVHWSVGESRTHAYPHISFQYLIKYPRQTAHSYKLLCLFLLTPIFPRVSHLKTRGVRIDYVCMYACMHIQYTIISRSRFWRCLASFQRTLSPRCPTLYCRLQITCHFSMFIRAKYYNFSHSYVLWCTCDFQHPIHL